MEMVETLELQVEEGGDRLDVWLAKELPDLSRSRLQNLIVNGHVWVDGDVCKEKKTKLQVGQKLVLKIPEPEKAPQSPQEIPLDILYEDEQLLILNKPANLVVHPAPGHFTGTLVNALLFHCKDLQGIGDVQRPGIVHRLDKDTTGALVVAKTELAYKNLQEQIQAKTARREYLGIVYGSPKEHQGMVDQPIGRHPKIRQKMAVVEGGRAAITHWQVMERLGNYTLMLFELHTGRTHQIRVHTSYLGHPIMGDPIYSNGGDFGVNLSGQALHAWRLSIKHPVSAEEIVAVAPPPEDFQKLLQKLRNSHKATV